MIVWTGCSGGRLRDLVQAPSDFVAAERARVATEGWGAVPGCWRCTLRVLRNGLDHRH
jgi:hypothetical protein